jgi:hypothetical protein
MAYTELSVNELTEQNKFGEQAAYSGLLSAVTADGASFIMNGQDTKFLVLIQNGHATAAKTATVKSGNGLQGVNDITVSIAAGNYTYVVLESGKFKNVSGDDKGKVIIVGESTDIKIAVFKLP